MATSFPTGLDALTNPTSADGLNSPDHAGQHSNANDAIEALEAKVGVDSSAVTSSLDYKVKNINAVSAVVSASSSSDLVRITQTGTGNALLVEDSTNPDSTPFIITAGGQVVVGNTAFTSIGLVTPQIQVQGTTASSSASAALRYSADVSSPRLQLAKSRNATLGSHTTVVAGDDLGILEFFGSDGTAFKNAGGITYGAEGTISTGVVPSNLRLSTTNASGVVTERMRIDSLGNVGVAVSSPTSTFHLAGSFSRGAPVTKTASFTLADSENWIICNGTASITVTLPAASAQVGREISLKNIAAFTVVSASSNVVPLTTTTAGTAILAATAGKWATLVSNGTNWVIMIAA